MAGLKPLYAHAFSFGQMPFLQAFLCLFDQSADNFFNGLFRQCCAAFHRHKVNLVCFATLSSPNLPPPPTSKGSALKHCPSPEPEGAASGRGDSLYIL